MSSWRTHSVSFTVLEGMVVIVLMGVLGRLWASALIKPNSLLIWVGPCSISFFD